MENWWDMNNEKLKQLLGLEFGETRNVNGREIRDLYVDDFKDAEWNKIGTLYTRVVPRQRTGWWEWIRVRIFRREPRLYQFGSVWFSPTEQEVQ